MCWEGHGGSSRQVPCKLGRNSAALANRSWAQTTPLSQLPGTGKSSHLAATGETSWGREDIRARSLRHPCPDHQPVSLGAEARERSRGAWRWEASFPTCQTQDLKHRQHGGLTRARRPGRNVNAPSAPTSCPPGSATTSLGTWTRGPGPQHGPPWMPGDTVSTS